MISQFPLTAPIPDPIIEMMNRSPLSRLENMLRKVVEEPFTWLGGQSLDPFQLATHLSRYYETPNADGKMLNHFKVLINPNDYREIEADIPVLQQQVGDYVALMAGRRGTHLKRPPTIAIVAHPDEKARSAHVVATVEEEPGVLDTAIQFVDQKDSVQVAIQEADAFLIVQGRQHIQLDRPVIRIGRRIDNDIVLDAPSISRDHAQIRWRQRYFVLYDVSRHGRTYVNGVKVSEHILRPSDVITLSDIFLVYGEGRDEGLAVSHPIDSDESGSTLLKPEE